MLYRLKYMVGGFLIVPVLLAWASIANAADACVEGMQAYVEGKHGVAFKKFEAAAKKGDGCAQFQLAMMYQYGHGTKKNEQLFQSWLKKSAAAGFEKAKLQLANLK
jgi:TPR repeat protein